jgi:WD repeat-containing protein 89
VRAILGNMGIPINYLVQCHFDPASDKLLLTAADWNGSCTVCEVSDSAISPVATLNGGHNAIIRCSLYENGKFITGGEDSRVCVWDMMNHQASQVNGRPKKDKGGGRERSEPKGRNTPY